MISLATGREHLAGAEQTRCTTRAAQLETELDHGSFDRTASSSHPRWQPPLDEGDDSSRNHDIAFRKTEKNQKIKGFFGETIDDLFLPNVARGSEGFGWYNQIHLDFQRRLEQ